QRRAFQFEFRTCAQVVGLKAPGEFQLAEVGCVDLIEGTISSVGEIGPIGRPIRILRLGRNKANPGDCNESGQGSLTNPHNPSLDTPVRIWRAVRVASIIDATQFFSGGWDAPEG